jgi:tRNA U34 5-methylaminomethyl-2-thiouridine-forming methyltransferase MnmC
MNSRKNKILKRKIILTKDGSHTIFIPELNENYHSVHGAEQESTHVFINAGLKLFTDIKKINILEIGFGTGLNALLTFYESKKHNAKIFYTSVEKYPITKEEADRLNYGIYNAEKEEIFTLLHKAKWNICIKISDNFYLKKINIDLKVFSPANKFNLIYFDAFAPDIQPDLWSIDIFKTLYNSLLKGGCLTTYSAKGQVRRNMQAAGFIVERLPGPPGKREMLRALKK